MAELIDAASSLSRETLPARLKIAETFFTANYYVFGADDKRRSVVLASPVDESPALDLRLGAYLTSADRGEIEVVFDDPTILDG